MTTNTHTLVNQRSTSLIPVGIEASLLVSHTDKLVPAHSIQFCTSIFNNLFELQPIGAERFLSTTDTSQAPSLESLCGFIFAEQAGWEQIIRQQLDALLPAESVQHLQNTVLCDHFFMRVMAYADCLNLRSSAVSAKDLIDFHARYKYLVMAHSAQHYKSLGHLLSNLHDCDLSAIADQYCQQLMAALANPATRKMHTNTLMHLQGYLKNHLTAAQKAELTQLIHRYRLGEVPLIKPLSLLNQHLNEHQDTLRYAVDQVYLNPIDLNIRH